MRELEIKLALPGRFVIPPLAIDGTALTQEVRPELDLRATYFDTADLRLARNGVTLRYRTGESGGPRWTLKLPLPAGGGATLARDELNFDAPRREPPAEARALVAAFVRREPLVAVATLRTKRRRWLYSHGDVEMAELADDEVSVVEGRRIVSRFRELELEAIADDAPLESLAGELRRAGATDAEPIPKVVRALGSRATAPPDVVRETLPAEPTVADALATSIADALQRLLRNDPLARLGDVEGLHQLRVALRRLRSDLRTLEDHLDPRWRVGIEPALHAVTDALGEKRDLDVLLEGIASEVDATSILAPLLSTLEKRRTGAQRNLTAALAQPEYVTLLDELVSAAKHPPMAADVQGRAAVILPPLVVGALDRFHKRSRDLGITSHDEDFHSSRIAAKRARYAAELAASVLPDRQGTGAARLAARLADAQGALGTLQDVAVAEAAIRDTLDGHRPSAEYAFEAGRLVERQRARAAEARRAFFDISDDLRRRRWRKWAS